MRTRQTVEPLRSYSVVRARREFANQSAFGFIATATNRNLDDDDAVPAGAGLHRRRRTGTGGWPSGTRSRGTSRGSSVRGEAEAITELQESNVHSFQRPDADYLEEDPTRTSLERLQRADRAEQDRRPARALQLATSRSRVPGSTATTSGSCAAPITRNMSNWLQWRNEKPNKVLRSFRFNLNQWAGWNYGGDLLSPAATSTRTRCSRTTGRPGWASTINPPPFDDRATRGGPGAYRNAQHSMWAYLSSDERRRVSAGVNIYRSNDGLGTTFRDFSPEVTWRPSSFLNVSGGLSLTRNHDQSQWIERGRRPLRVRADRSEHGRC